jgi:hypothetical protein
LGLRFETAIRKKEAGGARLIHRAEKVSWQFLSLRQHYREELSPTAFEHAQKVNNGGYSRANLRTALTRSEPETLSLGPFLSKPSDFADSVRFS